MLELRVFLDKLDLGLLIPVDADSELEQVDAFPALDHLVVEFHPKEGPVTVNCAASARNLTRKEKHVQVVLGFRAEVNHRATFSLHHQDDQDQVADHVEYSKRHHGGISPVGADQNQERYDLDDEVEAPEELIGVPLFRQTPLVLKNHEEAAKEPGTPLDCVEDHEVVVLANVDPAGVLGGRLLAPDDEEIDDVGGPHEARDDELELEVE